MMNEQIIFEFCIGGFLSDEIASASDEPLQVQKQTSTVLSYFSGVRGPTCNRSSVVRPSNWQLTVSADGSIIAILLTGRLICVNKKGEMLHQCDVPYSFRKYIRSRQLAWSSSSTCIFIYGDQDSVLVYSSSCELVCEVSKKTREACRYVFPVPVPIGSDSAASTEQFIAVYESSEVISWSVDCTGKACTQQSRFALQSGNTCTVESAAAAVLSGDGGILLVLATSTSASSPHVLLTACISKDHGFCGSASVQVGRGWSRSHHDGDVWADSAGAAPPSSLSMLQRGLSFLGAGESPVPLPVVDILLVPVPTSAGTSTTSANKAMAMNSFIALALHGDGLLSVCFCTSSTAHSGRPSLSALNEDRVSLPFAREQSPNWDRGRVTGVHLMAGLMVAAVTDDGYVGFFELVLDCSTQDGIKTVSGVRFRALPVDTLPPPLGPCASVSLRPVGGRGGSDGLGEGVVTQAEGASLVLLRAVDAWTVQLFHMTVMSPMRALRAKIGEGLFSSARVLAARLGVDGDVVSEAEWRTLWRSGRVQDSDLALLSRMHSDALVASLALEVCTSDAELWVEVLRTALDRCQIVCEQLSDQFRDSTWDEVLRRNLLTADQEQLLHARAQLLQRLCRLRLWRILRSSGLFSSIVEEAGDINAGRGQEGGSEVFHSEEERGYSVHEISLHQLRDVQSFVLHLSLFEVGAALAGAGALPELGQLVRLFPVALVPQLMGLLSFVPPASLGLGRGRESLARNLTRLLPVAVTLADDAVFEPRCVCVLVDGSRTPLVDTCAISGEGGDGDALQSLFSDTPKDGLFVSAAMSFYTKEGFPHGDLDLKTVFGVSAVAKWYALQALRLDSIGQSREAQSWCELGLERCNGESGRPPCRDVAFLKELSVQLRHFCRFLYEGMLPLSTSFCTWCRESFEERMKDLLTAVMTRDSSASGLMAAPIPIDVVISSHVRPLFTGNDRLFSACCISRFFEGMDSLCAELGAHMPTKRVTWTWPTEVPQWESLLVELLVNVCDSNSTPDVLNSAVALAEASLPTKPKDERCIQDVRCHVQFVLRFCRAFDDTAIGLSGMWALLETTPTKLPDFGGEEVPLAAALDLLQSALTACEVMRNYLAPPPLSVLLPDDSVSKMRRRRYIHILLIGRGWLVESVSVLLSHSAVIDKSGHVDSQNSPMLHDRHTLEQAIVLGMCFSTGERCQCLPNNSTGKAKVEEAWAAVAKDVLELADSFFPSLPRLWAGCVLLQSMLHFGHEDLLRSVVDSYQTSPVSKSKAATTLSGKKSIVGSSNSGDSVARQMFVKSMQAMGVGVDHVCTAVLDRAADVFNSLYSCEDPRLEEARELLSMLPVPADSEFSELFPSAPSTSLSTTASDITLLVAEKALHELALWLKWLGIDIVPLQLRMLRPDELVYSVLKKHPTALSYFSDEGYDYDDADRADCESLPPAEAQLLATTRPPRGALRLVSLLCMVTAATGKYNSDSMTGGSRRCLIWTALTKVHAENAQLLHTFLLSKRLLQELRTQSEALCTQVRRAASDVLKAAVRRLQNGLLDSTETRSGETSKSTVQKMHAALCSAILSSSAIAELPEALELWIEQCPTTSKSAGLSIDPPTSFADTVSTTGEVVNFDEQLRMAREDLMAVIGSIVTRPGDPAYGRTPLASALEVVSSAGAQGRLADSVGRLLLARNRDDAVQDLLSGLSRDMERKISVVTQAVRGEGAGGAALSGGYLDEDLANQLQAMGFSRNGSRRSVLATASSSFEAALRWAVTHGSDPDFEEPVTLVVSRALLPEHPQTRLEGRDLQRALMAIENVAGALSVTWSPPTAAAAATTADNDLQTASPTITSREDVGNERETAAKSVSALVRIEKSAADFQPCAENGHETLSAEDDRSPTSLPAAVSETSTPSSAPSLALDSIKPSFLSSHLARASAIAALEVALTTADDALGLGLHAGDVGASARVVVMREQDYDIRLDWIFNTLDIMARHRNEDGWSVLGPAVVDAMPSYAYRGFQTRYTVTSITGDGIKLTSSGRLTGAPCSPDDGPTVTSTDVKWMLAALRFRHSLASMAAGLEGGGVELSAQCIALLQSRRDPFLELLHNAYESCPGDSLPVLTLLKRLAGETVSLATQPPTTDTESTAASRTLSKRLLEEAACLQRIRRLGPWVDESPPNCKVLLMSAHLTDGTIGTALAEDGGELISDAPRLDKDKDKERDRQAALAELRRFLRPSPVAAISAWHRAVGRSLSVTQADLHLLCAVNSLIRLHSQLRVEAKKAPADAENAHTEAVVDVTSEWSHEADLELLPQLSRLSSLQLLSVCRGAVDVQLFELESYVLKFLEREGSSDVSSSVSTTFGASSAASGLLWEEQCWLLRACTRQLRSRVENSVEGGLGGKESRPHTRSLQREKDKSKASAISSDGDVDQRILLLLELLERSLQALCAVPDDLRPKLYQGFCSPPAERSQTVCDVLVSALRDPRWSTESCAAAFSALGVEAGERDRGRVWLVEGGRDGAGAGLSSQRVFCAAVQELASVHDINEAVSGTRTVVRQMTTLLVGQESRRAVARAAIGDLCRVGPSSDWSDETILSVASEVLLLGRGDVLSHDEDGVELDSLRLLRTRALLSASRHLFAVRSPPPVSLANGLDALPDSVLRLPHPGLSEVFDGVLLSGGGGGGGESEMCRAAEVVTLLASLLSTWGGSAPDGRSVLSCWAGIVEAPRSVLADWAAPLWLRLFSWCSATAGRLPSRGGSTFGSAVLGAATLHLQAFRLGELAVSSVHEHAADQSEMSGGAVAELVKVLMGAAEELSGPWSTQLRVLLGGESARTVLRQLEARAQTRMQSVDGEVEDDDDDDAFCLLLLPCVLPGSEWARSALLPRMLKCRQLHRQRSVPGKERLTTLQSLLYLSGSPSTTQSTPVPLIATGTFLALRLASEGFSLQASNVFWASQGRPAGLFSPSIAFSYMQSCFRNTCCADVHLIGVPEASRGQLGWEHLPDLCRLALMQ